MQALRVYALKSTSKFALQNALPQRLRSTPDHGQCTAIDSVALPQTIPIPTPTHLIYTRRMYVQVSTVSLYRPSPNY